MKDFVIVQYISESSDPFTDIEIARRNTDIQEAVAAYRQLVILQTIRYWVELIGNLGFKAQKMNPTKLKIPYH